MTYEEFGKLRFLDFFPKTDAYQEDHEGGMETGIGVACIEGHSDTMFTSPVDSDWQTAEMILEFSDCPEAQGHALLQALGLPIRRGMSVEQVRESLGVPEVDSPQWLRFVVGESHPYYVGCLITESGLHRVWIGRKDLADENEAS
jgi:hypothetical protein